MRQPELKTVFGVRWYGRAETVTGHVWWYTDENGYRHPLLPVQACAEKQEPSWGHEQAKKRPKNYERLSAEEQWMIDKELGILDWDGHGP